MRGRRFKGTAAAVVLAACVALASAQPLPAGLTRTDLQRHDLSIKGAEVLQARVDFAPGASFPSHKHPGEEIIYVLARTIEYEVNGRPVTLETGDVLPYGTVFK